MTNNINCDLFSIIGSTPLPPLWSFGLQCEIPDMTAETDIKLLEGISI